MGRHFELIITGLRAHRILEISQVLAQAAIIQGLDVKAAEFTNEPLLITEIAHIRIGEKIYSPLISKGKLDVLACLEPIMAARLIAEYLLPEVIIIMNTNSVLSSRRSSNEIVSFYEHLVKRIIKLDVFKIAEEAGDVSKCNFVMFGALDGLKVMPIDTSTIIKAAEEIMDLRDLKTCIKAIELGSKVVSASRL